MAPVILLLAWEGGWWFALLLAIIGLYGLYEWNRMSGVVGRRLMIIYMITLSGAVYLLMTQSGLTGLAVIAGGAILAGTVAMRSGLAVWPMAGLLYLGAGVLSLIWIREAHGPLVTFWVLFLVWASDIAAYITGSLVGGPKLAPRLSPGKTWSGFLGGGVGAALVSGFFGHVAGLGAPFQLALAGLVLAGWSQLGDIVESTIKRRFNVKDSGRLIPGHGGVLDRIDSLLFTVPVVALALYLTDILGFALYG